MKNYQIFIFVFLLLGLTFNINAQNDTTLTSKKNEIGINIGPIILVSLGGTPYPQPLSITYKRVKNKWAIRTNFTYVSYSNHWSGFNSEQVFQTDTTYEIRTTARKSNSFIGRIGFEYRHKLKSGLYFVGGADLQGQLTKGVRQINEANYRIDSISRIGTAEQYFHRTFLGSNNLLQENYNTTQVGIGVSLGLMLPIGKRWWLLGQYRVESYFGPTKTTTTDKIKGTTVKNNSTTFDFNAGPALTELSLSYRF